MKSKLLFALLTFTLLFSACVTEYHAILSKNTRVLFVDGSIIENTEATFYITQSFPLNVSGIPSEAFVNDAILQIIDSNGNVSEPAISLGRGAYRIRIGELDANVEYGIRIERDGEIFLSTLSRPLITPEIDSISFRQNSNGTVSIHVSTHDDTGDARFFLWNYVEDWEIRAFMPTSIFFNPQNREFYLDSSYPFQRCWKHHNSDRFLLGSTEALSENRLINHQLYEHSVEDDRFSRLHSILVTQRAISRGAYEFFENLRQQNEGMGGIFTPQPTEVLGNIRNTTNPEQRVLGYVGVVKNISQKRFFLDAGSINRPPIDRSCNRVFLSGEGGLTILPPEENARLYESGLRPSRLHAPSLDGGRILPAEWALIHCTDCREMGGTLERPDFWPGGDW